MAVALRAFRQDIVRAAGVARFMNLISNATSLLTFMALASVDYGLGLIMGIALIIGVDRLLDMLRTAVNITGDCMVTSVVARSENLFDDAVFDETSDRDTYSEGSGGVR
jgi:Na+/H+-dicarboxylate symporter